MKIRMDRSAWFMLTALGLALVVSLAFFYARTQDRGGSTYFDDAAIVHKLNQLDTRWELDVMRSKSGIYTNYDRLVDPLVELGALQGQLHSRLNSRDRHAIAALDSALQAKTRLIEQFKSHNAVLRNSLSFLPTALVDVLAAATNNSNASSASIGPVTTDSRALLLATMVYSQAPTDDAGAPIETRLRRLEASMRNVAGIQPTLAIFAAHVRTVLREQPLVNRLIRDIAAAPTNARIADIDRVLNVRHKEAERRVGVYRFLLLAFAASLAVLLIGAALWLVRNGVPFDVAFALEPADRTHWCEIVTGFYAQGG